MLTIEIMYTVYRYLAAVRRLFTAGGHFFAQGLQPFYGLAKSLQLQLPTAQYSGLWVIIMRDNNYLVPVSYVNWKPGHEITNYSHQLHCTPSIHVRASGDVWVTHTCPRSTDDKECCSNAVKYFGCPWRLSFYTIPSFIPCVCLSLNSTKPW